MNGEPDEFITVAEVASILKLNQQTVRNWIDQGKLPHVRIGRRVRIRRADFDALVEGGYSGPGRAVGSIEGIWGGEVPQPVPPPSR